MTQDAVGVTGPVPFQPVLYDVLDIQPAMAPDANGFPVQGLRFTFSVAGAGNQYMVLPLAGLTEEIVLAAIQDRVALILSILEIVGPPVAFGPTGKPYPININPAV